MSDSTKLNFTKRNLDALALPEHGRLRVYDEGGRDSVKGLSLRVTAAGSKSFVVVKWQAGKPVSVTLGKYPGMSIETARRLALDELNKLHHGVNPNVVKKLEKIKAVTLAEAFAAYLATRSLKPGTVKDMRVALEHIAADWMSKPLEKITPAMVEKRHREFAEGRSPARANLGMRYLRAIFNYAIAKYKDDSGKPVLGVNPVRILSELKAWERIQRRQTFIHPHQVKPWFDAVRALPGEDWRDFFQLVLLTGLRREEALGLLWSDVDFVGRTLTVRDTKNHSDHTLPLPDYLLALLAARREASEARATSARSVFVFADSTGRRIANVRYAQAAVVRGSGVEFTVHDLRRTFATVAESLDIPGYALKRLLNHTTSNDVTSGYLIITVERLRGPMDKICEYVLKLAGVLPSAEVIELADHREERGG